MAQRFPLIKSRTRRGATLIEVLIGCGVFTFMMLASIAILNIGTGGWRTIESRAEVSRALNVFENDIVTELKRGSQKSVGVYTPSSDYRWALWFKTAMNESTSTDYINTDGSPKKLGDPMMQIMYPLDSPAILKGTPVMQRYVVYYVTRPDAAWHLAHYGFLCSSYNSTAGPDTTCPHKWLVKKDVNLKDNVGSDLIGLQTDANAASNLQRITHDASVTESALFSQQESVSSGSNIHRVRVLGTNILSFEVTRLEPGADPQTPPTVSASGSIILFDIKAFKILNSSDKVTVGQNSAVTVERDTASNMVKVRYSVDQNGVKSMHTDSSVTDRSLAPFSVQLDNRIVPGND